MNRQPDLFPEEPLNITPLAGEREPRLWVRRLTLWKDAGTTIRDIELRPGLNIVWSPDPADAAGGPANDRLGHGSGKTLLCRLLRYCLGEQGHSTDEQRQHIAAAFPQGRVTAEVMLCGELWGVVRSLASGREHYAVKGQLPEALLQSPAEQWGGIASLMQAIQDQVLTPPIVALMQAERAHDPWLLALAWLTRDQECRFDKALDWRAADSESGSPVRSMSQTRLLEALRALLGAISSDEIAARVEISQLEENVKLSSTQVERLQWQVQRSRRELADAVGLHLDELPGGMLCVDVVRRTATERLAKLAKIDTAHVGSDVAESRAKYEAQQAVVIDLEKNEAVANGAVAALEALQQALRGEQSAGQVQLQDAHTPVCMICEVPIDRALAEGCKLSHKLPDIAGLQRRAEANNKKIRQCGVDLSANRDVARKSAQALPAARVRLRDLRKSLEAAERAQSARSGAWLKARQAIDGAKRLADLYAELEIAQQKHGAQSAEIESRRQQLGIYRDAAQRATFDKLSSYFDAVIRALVAPEARGRVILGSDRLKLDVEWGGSRSTAAIESLKVIAFDLAALCMSIEGRTFAPAFFVHDSPREADLGLSVYRRLFAFVAALEKTGPVLFQYIVTTTTSPPKTLRDKPWLRETLFGSPAHRRLLGVDL